MDIWGIIFPRKCFGCGKFGRYLCGTCLDAIPEIMPICPVCKARSKRGFTHKRCRRNDNPDRLIAIFPYQGVVKKAILTMKYKFAFDIARELSYLLDSKLALKGEYLVVPMPLYRQRLYYRGFNQSEILARELTKNRGWKLVPDLLLKIISTKPQAGLGKKERSTNVQKAFSINPKYLSYKITKPVILVDDVWTTGNTLKEGARVLKEFGFPQVLALVLARPVKK